MFLSLLLLYLLLPRAAVPGCSWSPHAQCRLHLKMLRDELIRYAQKHDGQLPTADRWCEFLIADIQEEYGAVDIAKVLKCPNASGQRCAYGLNGNLSRCDLNVLDEACKARMVLLFEIDGGWNVAGGPKLLASSPRHSGGYHILFLDGHVSALSKEAAAAATWAAE